MNVLGHSLHAKDLTGPVAVVAVVLEVVSSLLAESFWSAGEGFDDEEGELVVEVFLSACLWGKIMNNK